MLFKITVITAVVTGCFTSDICPNNTERLFFTAEYPFSLSGSQRIELNFENSTSVTTKWPFLNEPEYMEYIRSFQLPNILVLEYDNDPISSMLIYHQAMKKIFKVNLPSEDAGLYKDAVFEVDNVLYYCGVAWNQRDERETVCYKFDTENSTFVEQASMKMTNGRDYLIVVTVADQPCMLSPNITTQCLNTTTMKWYDNRAFPVLQDGYGLSKGRGIVHNDTLYICGLWIDYDDHDGQRQCVKYQLSNGYESLPMTQFPGIGLQRYFELFIQDNKVFAAGVVATPRDRFKNAVMFEVDNLENKIEIKGPFESNVFISMCSGSSLYDEMLP